MTLSANNDGLYPSTETYPGTETYPVQDLPVLFTDAPGTETLTGDPLDTLTLTPAPLRTS